MTQALWQLLSGQLQAPPEGLLPWFLSPSPPLSGLCLPERAGHVVCSRKDVHPSPHPAALGPLLTSHFRRGQRLRL